MARLRNLSTEQIEESHNLDDRVRAAVTIIHALDYLRESGGLSVPRVRAMTLLQDGLKNALDGRSTGEEWRSVRHAYCVERDGPSPPKARDLRCYACGAVDPDPFSLCGHHFGDRQRSAADPAAHAGRDVSEEGSGRER